MSSKDAWYADIDDINFHMSLFSTRLTAHSCGILLQLSGPPGCVALSQQINVHDHTINLLWSVDFMNLIKSSFSF